MPLQQTQGVQIRGRDEQAFATLTQDSAKQRLDVSAAVIGTLVPEDYDAMVLTYVAAGDGAGKVETVTYKTGGVSGTPVAILTLTYNTANKVAAVART